MADPAGEITAILDVAKWLLAPGVSLWLLRSVMGLRDDVRDLKREVIGVDGTNGLKSRVVRNEARLEVLEDQKIAMDAVEKAERERYHGEERRGGVRRLRDMIREEHQRPHEEKP